MAVLVAAVVLVAWAPGLDAPYQYDDWITPVKDPASQSLSEWARALPLTLRPLTKLSYALESSLGLTEAPERRVLSATLLLLCAALVSALSRRAGARTLLGVACGALWCVHPANAELMLALSGRSVLLSLALMLASALAWLTGRGRAALACALLAVLARETAWLWLVVCAGLLARGSGEETWTRRRVRVLGALSAALVGGAALVLTSARMRELLVYSWTDGAALDRLGLQWAAIPHGVVRWMIAPSSLCIDVDFFVSGPARALSILLGFGMVGGAGWLVVRRASSPALRVAALLWLSLMLPTHSVVPKLDPLTARTFAASSAAVLVGLASLMPALRGRWPRAHVAAGAVVLAWCALLVPQARARAALQQDAVPLWRDAATRSTHGTRPLVNLGTVLAQRGELDEARAALQEAARRAPHDAEVRARIDAVETLAATRKLLTDPL